MSSFNLVASRNDVFELPANLNPRSENYDNTVQGFIMAFAKTERPSIKQWMSMYNLMVTPGRYMNIAYRVIVNKFVNIGNLGEPELVSLDFMLSNMDQVVEKILFEIKRYVSFDNNFYVSTIVQSTDHCPYHRISVHLHASCDLLIADRSGYAYDLFLKTNSPEIVDIDCTLDEMKQLK